MHCAIPLHAAKKQGAPEIVRAKVELEVVAVSNMPDAEIVVLRFAMDNEICPLGQVVIDQYLHFMRQKARPAHYRKRRQIEQQDDRD
ncbi:hypothetical protein V6N13_116150 [Hibiscus sabdariffa]